MAVETGFPCVPTIYKIEGGWGGCFFKKGTCLILWPCRWVLIWRGVWCFLWGGCLFAKLLVELVQWVKLLVADFFQKNWKSNPALWWGIWAQFALPPQGGGGEGGNKQAYLLKFKCRGDVESLIWLTHKIFTMEVWHSHERAYEPKAINWQRDFLGPMSQWWV